MPTNTDLEILQNNFEKFQKIMKNLKYWKTVSETEIGQIEQHADVGFPVLVRADSRSENPNPIHNNISNHKSKANTGRKLNNTVEKNLGHVSEYVSRVRGATIYPPNKSFVLEISIRKEMNMKIKN